MSLIQSTCQKLKGVTLIALTGTLCKGGSSRVLQGPKGLPVLGNSLELDASQAHQLFTRWSKQYGKIFRLKVFGKNVVVISDANTLRAAFSSGALGKHLNDRAENITKEVFYGRKHMGFANLSDQTVFLRNVLRRKVLHYQMCNSIFVEACSTTISNFAMNLNNGAETIDPDALIKEFLTQLNSTILIGESLPDDDPEVEALWEFIDSLYRLLPPSIVAPLRAFPWLRHLPIKHGRYFRLAIDARDRVTRRYFDTQKSTYKEGHVRGLIDICLRIQQQALATSGTSWLTDDYIKGLMLDTVVAGMSEMIKSIRMLILLMCRHQDVQSRVNTEIRDVIGPVGTPSTNHREAMTYTQAVIMEMLRYVSQTPLAIPHKCNEDVVLDGYAILKDTAILPNIWGIHHDEDVWGDPWDFRPERFLCAEDGKKLLPADHKFMKTLIPFSVGKRRCPGEDFAMSRLFLVLTSLLQRLHFRPPEGEELPSVDPRH
ncbi:hypothetical protein DPMN_012736 [Dreissena polymorpha]|uniref:Cytochrome P450 n=1 Tax=Dreissena polymorpha TaxID=45954 RepID=A0A9D4N634_DREPO|nr:hypothetical protein DPMN_012736 [Dreissena polymorpha]